MPEVQQVCRWVGLGVGLDLHREFCVVGICQDGVDRSAGRVAMTPEALEVLAASSGADRPGDDRGVGRILGGREDSRAAREPGGGRVSRVVNGGVVGV